MSKRGEVAQTWVVAAGGGDSMRHRSSTLICYRHWTATRWRKRHTYSVAHMERDFRSTLYTSISSNCEYILHAANAVTQFPHRYFHLIENIIQAKQIRSDHD